MTTKNIVRISLISLLAINLIILDWKVFFSGSKNELRIPIINNSESNNQTQSVSVSGPSCSSGCLQKIKEATASIQIADTLQQPEQSAESSVVQTVQTVSEFFVPLGSGSTREQNWTTIDGIEAQINTSRYNHIAKVSFEASLRIPTGVGQLGARLINLSDNVPLAETEVFLEGTDSKRLERTFTLREGNKVYGVQLRSTIGALGVLDIARIKILTN